MSAPNPIDGFTVMLQQLVDQAVEQAITRELAARQPAGGATDGALRVVKVAEQLDVGATTVRRMIESGELETIDIAGITHVRTSEITRWLDEQTARSRRHRIANEARANRRRRGRASA